MIERIKNLLNVIGSYCVTHQTLYFCLFLSYAAVLAGADKHSVEMVPTFCYLMLALHHRE